MTDRDMQQPSPPDREDEMTGEAPAETGTTPYEAEVEAERQGTTADEVAGEVADDEAQPLDAGYRPKSG